MNTNRFSFPEAEIERYRRHGIARAILNKIESVPDPENKDIVCYSIDLTPLVRIEKPYHWNMKTPPKAPTFLIYTERGAKSHRGHYLYEAPDCTFFDKDREVSSLEVEVNHSCPFPPYDIDINFNYEPDEETEIQGEQK